MDTITVETVDEMETVVEEKEEEGYTVEVGQKVHDEVESEDTYVLDVINGTVYGATENDNQTDEYTGSSVDDLLENTFSDYEDDEVKVVFTVTEDLETTGGEEVVPNELAAGLSSLFYIIQGYETEVTQNNTEATEFEMNSAIADGPLADAQIVLQAAIDNPNKEIRDVEYEATEASEDSFYDSDQEADAAAAQMRRSGDYSRVEVEEVHNVTVGGLSRRACMNYVNGDTYADYVTRNCYADNPRLGLLSTYTFVATTQARVTGYYYILNGSYVATDYTVSYTRTEGTITVLKETYDKYYEIDGERPMYTVVTTSEKKENDKCITTTDTVPEAAAPATEKTVPEKLVNTGVNENTNYGFVLAFSSLTLFAALLLKKRMN